MMISFLLQCTTEKMILTLRMVKIRSVSKIVGRNDILPTNEKRKQARYTYHYQTFAGHFFIDYCWGGETGDKIHRVFLSLRAHRIEHNTQHVQSWWITRVYVAARVRTVHTNRRSNRKLNKPDDIKKQWKQYGCGKSEKIRWPFNTSQQSKFEEPVVGMVVQRSQLKIQTRVLRLEPGDVWFFLYIEYVIA